MRRIGVKFAGAVALMGMVAGCGGPAAVVSHPSHAVTLTFWYSGSEPTTMNPMVASFERKYPNIKVVASHVSKTNNFAAYTTAMAGGGSPDVIMTGAVPSWYATGLLKPLNPDLKTYHITIPSYFSSTLAPLKYHGQLYGLQAEVDEPMLMWNKQLFQKAGLNPNQPPQTIAQLTQDIKKLTIIKNGHLVQAGLIPSQGWGNAVWLRYFGGSWYSQSNGHFLADSPKAVTTLRWLKQVYDMQGGYNQAAALVSSAPFNSPFFAGNMAMYVAGEWISHGITVKAPKIQYGVAPMPVATGYKPGSLTYLATGDSYFLPTQSHHPHSALIFMRYMETAAMVDYYDHSAVNLPPIPSDAAVNGTFAKKNPGLRPWLAEMFRGRSQPSTTSPVTTYWYTTRSTYEQEILTGSVGVRQGLQALQKNVTQYAAQHK